MSSFTDVRKCAMTLPRIDTHSHFQPDFADLRAVAEGYKDFGAEPAMVESQIAAAGCRQLYGIDPGLFLRPTAPTEIFTRAAQLRAQGPGRALERALDAEHITTQFCFCLHEPENVVLTKLSPRVRLLAFIDQAVAGDLFAFCPDGRDMVFNYYEAICGLFGALNELEDYLNAIDAAIDTWRSHGVVGMKIALAYTLGLKFTDPSLAEAKSAFAKKRDMSAGEITVVQHYALRHALLACKRNGLPVVIHTGFPIWGHADLQQTNPILLHNLLIDKRYKDITFVLLHGGNPYVGETTYLARMFPNVIIDFTWISWMTRTRFHMALAEWTEVVAHSKFCWGSDSDSPERIVGIGQLSRGTIADVLDDLIKQRIMDEDVALNFLQLAYQTNPKRIFGV